MKKFYLTLTCMASLFMMTACGGNTTDSSDKITAEDVEELVETGMFGKYSMDAAQAGFKGIGLTVEKVAPDYKYLTEDSIKAFHGIVYQGRHQATAVFIKEDRTDASREEFEAYVRKIYAVTQDISDDKKVVYGFEKRSKAEEAAEEWAVDDILAQNMFGMKLSSYDWGFKRDGKYMRMSVELTDANKKYPARLKVTFYDALQKSFDETMKDAEKALEDPNVQEAIKDAFKK